jgi:hypothetical protein
MGFSGGCCDARGAGDPAMVGALQRRINATSTIVPGDRRQAIENNATRQGLMSRAGIIRASHTTVESQAMDAERINALANTLGDLTQRSSELRRYL